MCAPRATANACPTMACCVGVKTSMFSTGAPRVRGSGRSALPCWPAPHRSREADTDEEGAVHVQGIVFAGTGTAARPEMAAFVRDVLGLTPAHVSGVEADLFDLPDGSSFAVASPEGMGATDRSLGF